MTYELTDAQVDAAQQAFHDFTWGPCEPLTRRELGITRQAWRVAILAALGEPEYEYAVMWPLSKEAHGTGKYSIELFDSESAARFEINSFGYGLLVRRPKKEWEEVA
jgi:hypothetical protein